MLEYNYTVIRRIGPRAVRSARNGSHFVDRPGPNKKAWYDVPRKDLLSRQPSPPNQNHKETCNRCEEF